MAIPQPARSNPSVTVGRRRPPFSWAIWIGLSILGAVLGGLAAWQVRSLGLTLNWSAAQEDALRSVATLASAVVAAAPQWWVLRRYGLDAYWWVPASVAGGLVAALVVLPTVIRMVAPPAGQPAPGLGTVILLGAIALGASGLLIGAAQAWVLKLTVGNAAWLWVPATVVGSVLSGAATTALSSQLFGMAPLGTISAVAALGSLLVAGCQVPLIVRFLR